MKHCFVGGLAAVLVPAFVRIQSADRAGESEGRRRRVSVDGGTPTGPLTIGARPERIVSLSPTATEMLFEIGAGSRWSRWTTGPNYPAWSPPTSPATSRTSRRSRPTTRIWSCTRRSRAILARRSTASIPALLQPAAVTLEDVYGQVEQLGEGDGSRRRGH